MSFLQTLLPSDPSGARSKTFAKVLAWAIGLGSAVLIAPIVFLAVKGIVGLILAVAIGYTGMKLAPWFGTVVSNLSLKLIRWEARINPIETMMNVYQERSEATKEAEVQIKAFNGQVNAYAGQVATMAKRYPEDAKKFQDHLAAMRELLNRRYGALEVAKNRLAKYYEGIERASAIWDMTKASDAISRSAGLLSEKDAIQRIKSDEALKSVEDSMARSFAELDHALRTELADDGTPALEAPSQPAMLMPNHSGVFVVEPDPVQQRRYS